MRGRSVLGGPASAPAALQIGNRDLGRLILLAGVVLVVFWSGVAVGFGFSNREDSSALKRPSFLFSSRVASSAGGVRANDASSHLRGGAEAPPPPAEDRSDVLSRKSSAVGGMTGPPESTRFNGFSTMAILHGKKSLDFETGVTVSAWIRLAGEQRTMRTIVSNRESGCEHTNGKHGYALYVNEWDTNDGRLVFMWCTSESSCQKVSSEPRAIVPGTWYHVVATLSSSLESTTTQAELYINGVSRGFASSTAPRQVGRNGVNTFHIGGHPGRDPYPFSGKLAHVAVASKPLASWATFSEFSAPPSAAAYFPLVKVGGNTLLDGLEWRDIGTTPSPTVAFNFQIQPPADKSFMAQGVWPPGGEVHGKIDASLTPEILAESDRRARQQREVVRDAMKHAYGNYEKYAFGHDEVTPRTANVRDNWGGMGTTMLDALDTLWIMGMKDEFWRARDWCRDKLTFKNVRGPVSFFETTIRALGGLLSAYDLSGDKAFLERARELGDGLLPAFNTDGGLPVNSINLNGSPTAKMHGGQVVLAEIGTVQLEFRSLAYHTGDPKYARISEKVHTQLRRQPPANGLWPIYASASTGLSTGGMVTFGALGDSFFEYLLKIWVQGGRTEQAYLDDYDRAVEGIHKIILQRSSPSGLLYLADFQGSLNHKMDHLACFVPGMLALGAIKRPDYPAEKRKRDIQVAKALTYTCVQFYERTETGVSPEYVRFHAGQDFTVPNDAPFYILRPETVESLWIMHVVTKHPIYRDWAHRIMLNLIKYSKTTYGFGAMPDVRRVNAQPDDRMESFFLAETLKYLFLIQDPDGFINLDDYVFNTEAHPLKVLPMGWRQKLGLN